MPDPTPPTGLKAWGQRLWDEVTKENSFDAAGYFVLAEAARTADIIEKLSGALRSNNTTWIRLADEAQVHAEGETIEINIVVNPILGEIRQQRLTLRQLLAQLKLGSVSDTAAEDDPVTKMMADFDMPD
jgi:hypothetical protein